MQASANASALARTLLALARARATGQLRISGSGRQACELSVSCGHAHSLASFGETPSEVRLVLARALRWTSVRTQFVARPASVSDPLAPWHMGELLLRAAEHALQHEPLAGSSAQTLWVEHSAFGRALERARTQLLPAQLAQAELRLRPEQLAAWHESERARLRAALWLGALVPRHAATHQYTLLLRKHRQLRTRADAHALLELLPSAGAADARRALRRLASRLHPDALGPSAPPELRALSSELMCALVQAERAVRRETRA